MTDCNEKLTPSNTSGKPWDIYPHPNPNPVEENDPARVSLYRSIVGACIHPSVLTRPDLAYPCSACGQFLSNPSDQHLTAAYRMLRYLKGTKHYSLKYYPTGSDAGVGLTYWVDSNFMGDADSRSVGGHIAVSSNGVISWIAKRFATISTSTSHAETQAFFGCCKDNVFTRDQIDEFKFPNDVLHKPTTIFGDNSACMELVKSSNTGISQRTKHWRMNWHWLHEQRTALKTFQPVQVPSEQN